MRAAVFTVRADVDGFAAAIDARLGFPNPGVDVGGGLHAPAIQSRTLRHAEVVPHPTLPRWAYPVDESSPVPIPVTATVQVLDATWTPAAVPIGAAIEDA